MSTGSFQRRMGLAAKKEKEDAANLTQKCGCIVTPFGQGQLPEQVRDYLHKHPEADQIYLRWLPDQLAIRPDLCRAGVTECMWLPDSKYSPPEKHRYKDWLLEQEAHTAHRLQRIALGLPIVYIWPDGISCSYVEDLPDEKLRAGTLHDGSGSGTPYWFVPKSLTRPLSEVFGKSIDAIKRNGYSTIANPHVPRHRGGLPESGYIKQMGPQDKAS